MKFYYNGKLVRTSENEYKYAIVRGNRVITCHTRYDLAEKELIKQLEKKNKIIESNERYLEEVKKGNKDEFLKSCNITREQEIEELTKLIPLQKQCSIKIVELTKQP